MPAPAMRPSSAEVSSRMSRLGRRDTKPELLLRRELHRRGLRYRVDKALPPLPRRRVDIVFGAAKVAVFVDGCFWHACPEHASWPAANAGWWRVKLEKNVSRDRHTDRALAEAGWQVIRIWEHEDPEAAADRVQAAVAARLAAPREGARALAEK